MAEANNTNWPLAMILNDEKPVELDDYEANIFQNSPNTCFMAEASKISKAP